MLGKTTKEKERPPGPPEKPSDTRSVISKEMHITGDCASGGPVRIEGRVSGNVTATGVEIATSGSVDGDVGATETADTAGPFVIDGRVAGTVRASHVRVGPRGSVEGGIRADEAVIHGRVVGGVFARRRLALEKTAKVEGDVYARRLALQEGGLVNGTIRMGEQEPPEVRDEPPVRGSGAESLRQSVAAN